jgi:hypothetical protein
VLPVGTGSGFRLRRRRGQNYPGAGLQTVWDADVVGGDLSRRSAARWHHPAAPRAAAACQHSANVRAVVGALLSASWCPVRRKSPGGRARGVLTRQMSGVRVPPRPPVGQPGDQCSARLRLMLPVVHRKRAVACTVRFHGQRTHCASDAGQFQDCVSERFGVLLGQLVAGVRDLAVGVGTGEVRRRWRAVGGRDVPSAWPSRTMVGTAIGDWSPRRRSISS